MRLRFSPVDQRPVVSAPDRQQMEQSCDQSVKAKTESRRVRISARGFSKSVSSFLCDACELDAPRLDRDSECVNETLPKLFRGATHATEAGRGSACARR